MSDNSNNANTSELLLKEYEMLHNLYGEERRQMEKRINFLFAIVSGSVAGLVAISKLKWFNDDVSFIITLVALAVLLDFSIKTMNRLSIRNIQLKKFRSLRDKILQYYSENDPRVKDYVDFQETIVNKKHKSERISIFLEWQQYSASLAAGHGE